MENKINIAEILKNCPKGMELDCTMWDSEAKVFFKEVLNDDFSYPIVVTVKYNNREYTISFNKYGTFNDFPYSKCIIFPKGKTTWEGYHRPFKDGDICITARGTLFIYQPITCYNFCGSYVSLDSYNAFNSHYASFPEDCCYLAAEEEKAKLFQAIKDNGYKWNAETKTLEKLVNPKFKVGDIVRSKNCIDAGNFIIVGVEENSYSINIKNYCIEFKDQDNYELVPNNLKKLVQPKFKVGDRIKQKGSPRSYIISSIEYDRYRLNNNQFIRFTDEHIYELYPNKFDINTLVPFDKVLVRCNTLEKWRIQLFEKYDKTYQHPFICMGCNKYNQCIPYEGNEHLLDTTDDCDEYFKSWKMD